MHFSWMLFIAWLNRFMSPDRIFCKSLSESTKFIGYLPTLIELSRNPKREECVVSGPFHRCVGTNQHSSRKRTNKNTNNNQINNQQPTNFFYSESCSLFSCRPKSIWWQFTIAIFIIHSQYVHKQLTHNFSIFSFVCGHHCMNRNFGSPPNGVISYQGFMTKRGANYKTWRKRYFILIPDGFLIYFKDADDLHHPLGIMYVLNEFFTRLLLFVFLSQSFFFCGLLLSNF